MQAVCSQLHNLLSRLRLHHLIFIGFEFIGQSVHQLTNTIHNNFLHKGLKLPRINNCRMNPILISEISSRSNLQLEKYGESVLYD